MLRITLLFFMFANFALAATLSPTLTVVTPATTKIFTRDMLLTMPIEQIKMNDNRAYLNQAMTVQAIRFCDLLQPFHILPTDTVELISSDNFAALVPAETIMSCSNQTATGYVAIEPEHHPWPPLKYNNPDKNHPDEGTAGPFAVIWVNPEKSYISNEYWAWKLVKIRVHHQLNNHDYLPAPATSNKKILNGYHAYISRCAGCHTINKIGSGVIGPDLNIPKNATEYFPNDNVLKKFIRDPQSVRVKANDRMSGTNEKFLSDQDLEDLIAYLRYMAKHE